MSPTSYSCHDEDVIANQILSNAGYDFEGGCQIMAQIFMCDTNILNFNHANFKFVKDVCKYSCGVCTSSNLIYIHILPYYLQQVLEAASIANFN